MLDILKADYANPAHREALVQLLDHYAISPAGGGKELSPQVKAQLPDKLAELPYVFSLLAFNNGEAIGLCNCILGFSTFNCKPIVNVHDLVVLERHRGQGVGTRLLEQVEAQARARGACKLTLEVLENNQRARNVYTKFGFEGYELCPEYGKALFLEKKL